MAIINITAFFIGLLMLAYFWKESLVEIFPVLTCMLVLMLYVLAFCHRFVCSLAHEQEVRAAGSIWKIVSDKCDTTVICHGNSAVDGRYFVYFPEGGELVG